VWYAGLPSWVRASELPELSDVFASPEPPPLPGAAPPPLPKVARATPRAVRSPRVKSGIKRSYLFGGIAVISVLLLSAIVYYFVHSKADSSDADTVEELPLSGSVTVTDTYSGGAGTEQNPYLISSRSDMEALSINVTRGHEYEDTCFLLTRDLTGRKDTVTTVIENFSGVFDGGGHSIAVNIDVRGEGYLCGGIFGQIFNATIKNLSVSGRISVAINSDVAGTEAYAGGIVGKLNIASYVEDDEKNN
jgi:hypothetical protein